MFVKRLVGPSGGYGKLVCVGLLDGAAGCSAGRRSGEFCARIRRWSRARGWCCGPWRPGTSWHSRRSRRYAAFCAVSLRRSFSVPRFVFRLLADGVVALYVSSLRCSWSAIRSWTWFLTFGVCVRYQTLVSTAHKLGVNIYQYIHDRIARNNVLPSLAALIQERAAALHLAASWAATTWTVSSHCANTEAIHPARTYLRSCWSLSLHLTTLPIPPDDRFFSPPIIEMILKKHV